MEALPNTLAELKRRICDKYLITYLIKLQNFSQVLFYYISSSKLLSYKDHPRGRIYKEQCNFYFIFSQAWHSGTSSSSSISSISISRTTDTTTAMFVVAILPNVYIWCVDISALGSGNQTNKISQTNSKITPKNFLNLYKQDHIKLYVHSCVKT